MGRITASMIVGAVWILLGLQMMRLSRGKGSTT
jgi:hypothetical protein